MIEPLKSAIEVWLGLYANLPLAVQNLCNLTLGLFIFTALWQIFYHIRGH